MGLVYLPSFVVYSYGKLPSLKLAAKAPENAWLEDDPFPFGMAENGRCEL